MAEKTVDRVIRIMKNAEQIRNIATCAHIDHGKCVAPETRIQLSDGDVIAAKDLFDLVSKRSNAVYQDEAKTVYDISNLNIKTCSYSKEKGILENKPITHAWKLRGGKTIKAHLRNGFEIETTPEHKYLVFENLAIKEKTANELKIGDRLVCARDIPTTNDTMLEQEILTRLQKGNFFAKLNDSFGRKLKEEILTKGLKETTQLINSSVKSKSFYHGMWQNRYSLNDLMLLGELLHISSKQLYDNIESITYRTGKHRGKSSLPVYLPKNFEDFFYLAGLFFGEGTTKKFVAGKKDLGNEFTRICTALGIKVGKRSYKGKTAELVSNATLMYMLHYLFDYPLKQKSHNINVNHFTYKAGKNCKAHFIRGYLDCGGTVEKGRSAVSVTSASANMLKDLQLLLQCLGCISQVQGDTLYISGFTLKNFNKQIGFGLPEKQEKAQKLATGSIGSEIFDVTLTKSEAGKGLKTPQMTAQLLLQVQKQLINLNQLVFIEIKSLSASYQEKVYDFSVPDNRNFLAEGIIIHNTTFSDNLLAGAGMMSEEDAGHALKLDFHEDEQERGITIDTAAVSMVHNFGGKEYLINLLDTPGHVDFGGDVTRAMRAVDGAIVLCDAVEGIMPQTETVLRQALKERVKPVLFINKVDRLIKELKLTPEKMQEGFIKVITSVNKLIRQIAESAYGEKWQTNVEEGSVAFGSALHNWALSIPYMKKKGITFKDVIDAYTSDDDEKRKELAKKAPLHEVVLNMVIRHHPNPVEAQSYRIPKIWHGELESEEGISLQKCDSSGPLFFVITKIVIDPQAGEISAGRLFSGTVKKGTEAYSFMGRTKTRLQQIFVYNGAKREIIDQAPAGNIIGIAGIKSFVGDTITLNETEPFEKISHIFDPVITKAISATKPADLPQLIEILKIVAKEDPTIKIEINEETGENLMHGMGELHLEVIENRIVSEKGLAVKTSNPIVVYRETITKASPVMEGKTPNKHNKFFYAVEPLSPEIRAAIKDGKIPETRIKKKDLAIRDAFVEAGMDSKQALKVKDIYKGNILVDGTRGIVQLGEVIEMILDMFEDVMDSGPLAKDPCIGVKLVIKDMKLHEDAIHRGPAQVYPALREASRGAILNAHPQMFEPYQILLIEAPDDFMGDLSKLVSNKRGQLLDMQQEGTLVTVKAKMPVAELLGWSSDLRSATGGRGTSSLIDQMFEKVPNELQQKVIQGIRQRKGLTDAM